MTRYLFIYLSLLLLAFQYDGKAQKLLSEEPGVFSLDGYWQFKTDPDRQGEKMGWYRRDWDDSSWDRMKVPGNWDLVNQYADYAGKAWYRRTFLVPQEWNGKWLRLIFESTSYYARVWLNGQLLGYNDKGLLPFHFDISPFVRADERNQLTVEIDNTFKLGALWNWGGINRSVRIEATDLQRIAYQHLTAVPDLKKKSAKIDIGVTLENDAEEEVRLDLKYTILNKDGLVKEGWKRNIVCRTGSSNTERLSVSLKPAETRLWHFDHPHLYSSKIDLYRNGTLIHSISDQFGIRKIEVEGYTLRLNGEPVRPVGFNLVPDDRTNGNTLPLWRIQEDVDKMKSLGANMARLSHIPLPKAFYDYLDEKGIMVFSEYPLWGKDRRVDPDHPAPVEGLAKIIQRQYNHPSIIGWSVGNEIGYATDNPKAMDYVKSAIGLVKGLDSTRLVSYVSHSAMNQTDDPAMFENFILLNSYSNWGKNAEKANIHFPGKPIFYSEYGKNIIHEDPDKGVVNPKEMLDDMRGREYLIGASLWTFNDYRSNYTGTAVSGNRAWGIVDVFRRPKRAWYAFKKEYAPVKGFSVNMIPNTPDPKLNISITPRDVRDIPAYAMRGYRVVWMGLANDKNITDGGFYELPLIHPGDPQLLKSVSLSKDIAKSTAIKIALLSPELYAVYDTTLYLASPATPELKAVFSSPKAIRVEYSPVPFAEGYRVIYGDDGGTWDTTVVSINHFIELENLDRNKHYKLGVIAVNGFGSSGPSLIREARLSNKELPPVIWKTESADGGFFIGYPVRPEDFLYDVEYGTSPGNYTDKLVVKTKGVLQVAHLKNGQTYYYRVRSRKQWGFESEWTTEGMAVPDGNLKPKPPRVYGVIRSGKDMLMHFEPAPKAIRYEVIHESKGKRMPALTNGTDIAYILLKNVSIGDKILFRAVNEYGKSDEVAVEVK